MKKKQEHFFEEVSNYTKYKLCDMNKYMRSYVTYGYIYILYKCYNNNLDIPLENFRSSINPLPNKYDVCPALLFPVDAVIDAMIVPAST